MVLVLLLPYSIGAEVLWAIAIRDHACMTVVLVLSKPVIADAKLNHPAHASFTVIFTVPVVDDARSFSSCSLVITI